MIQRFSTEIFRLLRNKLKYQNNKHNSFSIVHLDLKDLNFITKS